MATHRIPILGHATCPDATYGPFPAPFDVYATNDIWDFLVWVFGNTSYRIGLHGVFDVPQNYIGTPKLVIIWTTDQTSGNAMWDCDYRAVGGDDAESLDQTGNQESVYQADTAPSAAFERMVNTITLSSNFAAGDSVEFTLFRDTADAGDTLNGNVFLIGAYFQYDDA